MGVLTLLQAYAGSDANPLTAIVLWDPDFPQSKQ